jgi:hypothetical protein
MGCRRMVLFLKIKIGMRYLVVIFVAQRGGMLSNLVNRGIKFKGINVVSVVR